MPIPVATDTRYNWGSYAPTEAWPVSMSGRDLPADAVLPPHHHAWGQFAYAMEGVMRVTANNTSWIVPPQRAVWIAPEVEHTITVLEAIRMRPVYVHASRTPFSEVCKVVEVTSLLRELIAALEQLDRGDHSPRAHLLGEMIIDEMPRCPARPLRVPLPQDKRLKALCDALIADPGAPLTLEHWAAQVGASERTLVRLFEKELEMSFGQWRQQVRLAHAVPLMARGLPLSQVAEQLGYASQSAFSAMFKKTFGHPPSAFLAA